MFLGFCFVSFTLCLIVFHHITINVRGHLAGPGSPRPSWPLLKWMTGLIQLSKHVYVQGIKRWKLELETKFFISFLCIIFAFVLFPHQTWIGVQVFVSWLSRKRRDWKANNEPPCSFCKAEMKTSTYCRRENDAWGGGQKRTNQIMEKQEISSSYSSTISY